MSIVRIGMGEKKGYAEGYEAIFKKKGAKKPIPAATQPAPAATQPAAKAAPQAAATKKKPAAKKK